MATDAMQAWKPGHIGPLPVPNRPAAVSFKPSKTFLSRSHPPIRKGIS